MNMKKIIHGVRFELTHPGITGLKSVALDQLCHPCYNIKHFIFFSLHNNQILKNNKNSKNML